MNTGEVIALIKAFGGGGGGSSGGGVLVVHDVGGTLDKTWQQIHDAFVTVGAVIAYSDQDAKAISQVGYPNLSGSYYVDAGSMYYVIGEADGYPVFDAE